MARNWTDAQKAAIDTRGKTLLVSAAAGSGKTAALTERIIRALTDKENPADISKMLIVTFTRAAAAELRQRIFSAVNEALSNDPRNRHLSEQLVKLSSAKICTIDSFYLDAVRSNFDKLGISPSFKTADTIEIDLLSKSIMEDTIDAFYEEHPDDIVRISNCFVGLRNSDNLSNVLLSLYSDTESFPDGIGFLKKSAERTLSEAELDFFDTIFGASLRQNVLNELTYFYHIFKKNYQDLVGLNMPEVEKAYYPSFEYDLNFFEALIDLLGRSPYKDCRGAILAYSPQKLGSLKSEFKSVTTEKACEARKALSDKLKAISKSCFSLSPEVITKAMRETAEITFGIYDLLRNFEARFDEEKRIKNFYSFADIRRFAMKLLVDDKGEPTPTALEYSSQYSEIYIDEYQDVDRVQDLIFKAISKTTTRFMVGDIKQSIYSFRGAEPLVFASYRKSFPEVFSADEGSPNASVFMSNNFRCDKSVIDFTNTVCSFIFSVCTQSIGYTKEDDLVFSKISEDRVTPELPVEVDIILQDEEDESNENTENATSQDKEEEELKMVEARYVAKRIYELINFEKKANGERIKPHDIAILFRSKSTGEYMRKTLFDLGIECSDNTDAHYFENPDVLLVLCLLNAIDNPHKDIYLAGLLRSPFFNFSMDELIEMRSGSDSSLSLYDALCEYKKKGNSLAEKCVKFDEKLSEFRSFAACSPVDKLLQYLFSTELFAANGLVNCDDANNLIRLYEYARKYEASSFKGLYSFIAYIDKMISEKKTIDAASGDIVQNKVTFMTVHQSKGLEFPVCFLCNASAKFNMQDTRESLAMHSSLGVAMKLSDTTGMARMATPMREAITRVITDSQTEEEMRILYVALTRARERLFVTASSKMPKEKFLEKAEYKRNIRNRYAICSCNSFLEWIITAIDPENNNSFCNINFIPQSKALDFSAKQESTEDKISKENTDISEETIKTLTDRFSFEYPYKKLSKLPAKISVSRLLPESRKLSNEDDALRLFEKEDKESSVKKYCPPSSLTGILSDKTTPAMRGTATHLFLQFCDFEYAQKHGVEAELCRLIEKKFIPADSGDIVFKNELSLFFESELYSEIRKAKKVIREQRFNILLPPSILTADEEILRQAEGEQLAVQGVIDLLLEMPDGSLVLCDYKTDRLTKVELESDELLTKKMTERHAEQLKYYLESVKRLFGKLPERVLLYSTHKGKAVEIKI